MPFYLAWVYGKGQTFLEKLHTNSLPLHMVVLENTTLFFGQFRKGNVSPWDRCDTSSETFQMYNLPFYNFKLTAQQNEDAKVSLNYFNICLNDTPLL